MKDVRKLSSGRINVVAIMIIGLWLSVGLSGCDNKDAPPDFKSLLKDTGRYIDDIEHKNEKLTAKLTDMAKKLKRKSEEGDDENKGGDVEELMAKNQALMEEKEALVAETGRYTYAELRSLADKVAYGLLANGFSRGDRVMLQLPNWPEFIIAHYAIQKAGLGRFATVSDNSGSNSPIMPIIFLRLESIFEHLDLAASSI